MGDRKIGEIWPWIVCKEGSTDDMACGLFATAVAESGRGTVIGANQGKHSRLGVSPHPTTGTRQSVVSLLTFPEVNKSLLPRLYRRDVVNRSAVPDWKVPRPYFRAGSGRKRGIPPDLTRRARSWKGDVTVYTTGKRATPLKSLLWSRQQAIYSMTRPGLRDNILFLSSMAAVLADTSGC
jgi:hypothetical protein